MKIIQIFSNYTGSGQTAYVMELNRTLKELGHDVKVFKFSTNSNMNAGNPFNTEIMDIQQKTFSQDTYDEINSADMVVINGLAHKKETLEYKEAYYDMIEKYITTKKVFMIHSHICRPFLMANHSSRIMTKSFLLSIDHFCTFTLESEISLRIASVIGKEEFEKRFVRLYHPYHFDEDKHRWKPMNMKQHKISYFGRWCKIKDPYRVINMAKYLFPSKWQVELRGIEKTIGVSNIKNVIYHWDEETDTKTKEKSRICQFVGKDFRLEYNLKRASNDCDELVYTLPKVLIFARYNREHGFNTMSLQSFGCDFYNLENKAYGDAVEYVIYDIVNCGTIPLLDYDMGNTVHAYKDGKSTGKTLYELNAGIFVKSDLSNIDEVVEKIDFYWNNPDEYEKMRNKCFEIYKEHANPKVIISQFVEECSK